MVKVDFKPMAQPAAPVRSKNAASSKEVDFMSMIQRHASQEKAPAAKTENQEKAPASEADDQKKLSEADNRDKISKEDNPKVKDAETNEPETEEGISAQTIAQLQVSLQFAVPVNLEEILTEQSPENEMAGMQGAELAVGEVLPGIGQTEGISLDPAVFTLQEGETEDMAAVLKAATDDEARPAVQTEGTFTQEETAGTAGKEIPMEAISRSRQNESGNQKENSDSRGSESQSSTNAYSGVFRTQNTETLWSRSGLEKASDTTVVRTTPETFGPDIGKTLAARIPEQNGTLTIELEPASLGKLTIRVIYEAGKAAVSIMADNPKTLELLNQNAVEIARIMEEKTGQQTVIYTPEAQQQMGEKADGQGKGRQDQDQESRRQKEQSDAFAQQLRLGLL